MPGEVGCCAHTLLLGDLTPCGRDAFLDLPAVTRRRRTQADPTVCTTDRMLAQVDALANARQRRRRVT